MAAWSGWYPSPGILQIARKDPWPPEPTIRWSETELGMIGMRTEETALPADGHSLQPAHQPQLLACPSPLPAPPATCSLAAPHHTSKGRLRDWMSQGEKALSHRSPTDPVTREVEVCSYRDTQGQSQACSTLPSPTTSQLCTSPHSCFLQGQHCLNCCSIGSARPPAPGPLPQLCLPTQHQQSKVPYPPLPTLPLLSLTAGIGTDIDLETCTHGLTVLGQLSPQVPCGRKQAD